ncbi:MAG: extensin family protein [Pseudomonadota bacterium]
MTGRLFLGLALAGCLGSAALAQEPEAVPPPPERGAASPAGPANDELGGALPEPRPEEFEGEPADAETEELVSTDPTVEGGTQTCAERLTDLGVAFTQGDPIDGAGACGLRRPFVVTAIGEVALEGPATLNCATVEALAKLMRDHAAPAAEEHLGAAPSAIAIGSSYVCRGRNGRPGAKLSEHATGNGVDIMAFAFADRARIPVAAVDETRPEARFLADIRAGACTLFTTVLGPGSDPAHANHFHLDLRVRKNDYRICQ